MYFCCSYCFYRSQIKHQKILWDNLDVQNMQFSIDFLLYFTLYFCYFFLFFSFFIYTVMAMYLLLSFNLGLSKKKKVSFIYQSCHRIKKLSWYQSLGGVLLQLVTQSKHLPRCQLAVHSSKALSHMDQCLFSSSGSPPPPP